jgi:hypothetical protein
MSFDEFQELLLDHGVKTVDRGNGHWQIKAGPVTINYYPTSSRRTIYINAVPGVTNAQRHENADEETVIKLVKEFKDKLAKEMSNDTSSDSV